MVFTDSTVNCNLWIYDLNMGGLPHGMLTIQVARVNTIARQLGNMEAEIILSIFVNKAM